MPASGPEPGTPPEALSEPGLALGAAGPAGREAADVMVGTGPYRAAPGGQHRQRFRHYPGQGRRGELGEDEREVRRQLELIAPAVVGSHPGHVTHKGLAEQQPGRVEAVSDRASGAEHLMRLGLIGAARLVQAERGVQASAGPR